jgi:hypothetical protein
MRAMAVYADRDWYHIEDHVHFILGRQSFTLGDVQVCDARYWILLELPYLY